MFATSRNVADRLKRFNDIDAELLPHPPQSLPYREAEPEGFVALGQPARPRKADRPPDRCGESRPVLRVVIVGEGPDRERLEGLANGSVTFAGRVNDDELVDLYARSSAVFYAPIDEDFGMVPFEAFLSGKPVVTTTDAGGPLEVVHDRQTGSSPRPTRHRSPKRARTSSTHVDDAKGWGRAGRALAERVTWDACVDALLS